MEHYTVALLGASGTIALAPVFLIVQQPDLAMTCSDYGCILPVILPDLLSTVRAFQACFTGFCDCIRNTHVIISTGHAVG
jgi:hypothetical protein